SNVGVARISKRGSRGPHDSLSSLLSSTNAAGIGTWLVDEQQIHAAIDVQRTIAIDWTRQRGKVISCSDGPNAWLSCGVRAPAGCAVPLACRTPSASSSS